MVAKAAALATYAFPVQKAIQHVTNSITPEMMWVYIEIFRLVKIINLG